MDKLIPYYDILLKNPLFKGLRLEELEKEIERLDGKIKSYKKGEYLHRPNSKLKQFGFVLSGNVMACASDIDGNEVIMAEVQPGVTFGESLAFLKVSDSPVYVVASTDATVLWLNPESSERFTSLLATRTLTMNSRIQVLSQKTIRDKLMVYFSELAQRTGGKEFIVPMDREAMASYLGINRAALSRELSKMREEGLIDFNKNKFVLH